MFWTAPPGHHQIEDQIASEEERGDGFDELLRELSKRGVDFKDLQTSQSSLEEIFVSLVRSRA